MLKGIVNRESSCIRANDSVNWIVRASVPGLLHRISCGIGHSSSESDIVRSHQRLSASTLECLNARTPKCYGTIARKRLLDSSSFGKISYFSAISSTIDNGSIDPTLSIRNAVSYTHM